MNEWCTHTIEQGRRLVAAPSSYGVIIKLSRVETLVDNTSVLRIHQDGSGFSSCNRRIGTEVAGTGIALHQLSGLHQVHALLGPASNGGVIGEQLIGGLGQLKGVAEGTSVASLRDQEAAS